jgi:secreted trypsin-like serine protease
MCCRHPDWFGIPITTPVKITKPPPSVLIPCPDDKGPLIVEPVDPLPVVPTDPCNVEYFTDGIPENCPGYSVDPIPDPNIPDVSDPDPPIPVEPVDPLPVVPSDPCDVEYPPENCPGYSVDPIPDPNIPDVSDPDPKIPVEPVDPSPVVPSDPCDVEYPPENCPGYSGPDVDPNPGKGGDSGTGPDPFIGTCNTNPDFLKCGKRNLDGIGVRIQSQSSADRETQFGEWPHMCAVLNRTKIGDEEHSLFVCGGSLIAPNVILTAAHCVDSITDFSKLMVRCGEWDTQGDHEPLSHQDRFARKLLIHPGFVKKNLINDVAVIVLQEEFCLAQHIGTICLPNQDDYSNINWEGCVATGWGKDLWGQAGQYQVIMKQIEMNMVDHPTCQAKLRTTRLGEFFELHKSFNCAGGIGGEDACTGDGGGPLVCPVSGVQPGTGNDYEGDGDLVVGGRNNYQQTGDNSQALDPRENIPEVSYVQTGIIAWGVECGINGVPGVYANVSDALCFIDYATKCVMGQDADYYGLQGCQRWAKRTYCELQNSLQQYTDLIELTTELREKGKLFRKRRKIQKTLPGYEDLIFGCYNEYSTAREDFVVDCNEFDYYPEPEDNFDAETLQRNNLNKDN